MRTPMQRRVQVALMVTMLTVVAGGAQAQKTWSGTGDWFTATANWSPSPPADGDAVTVTTGSLLLLTNSTPELASFTLSGGTVTCSNWWAAVRATTVALNGGTLTCSGPFDYSDTAMSNRVWIVCSNLTVAAGGTRIDVTGKGYRLKQGPGASGALDQGAAHGGRGRNNAKATYGSLSYPDTPGSGGWEQQHGGGVVRIDASGTVTVNGIISANAGQSGSGYGGASGGSILIVCGTFAGSGTLTARANTTSHAQGGAAGGRIAVHYAAATSPTVTFNALSSYIDAGSNRPPMPLLNGAIGTVYLSDASFILGETMSRVGGFLHIPGFTAWSPNNLTVSDLALGLPDGFALSVSNNLTITGPSSGLQLGAFASLAVGGSLAVSRTSGTADGSQLMLNDSNAFTVAGGVALNVGHIWTRRPTAFDCSGDLSLTNASRFWVYSMPTNGVAPDYGTLIEVDGTLTVNNTSVVYPYSDSVNGGSALFRLANLDVRTGGKIIATGLGYAIEKGPGSGGQYIGGTHGGAGGGNTKPLYGSEQQPISAGSGGGTGGNATAGGGVVRIETIPTGRITVDGSIEANGADGSGHYSGRGAGGSIYLRCRTFAGGGTLLAKGGSNTSTGSTIRGGGGGRIAVWRTNHQWTGATLDNATLCAGGVSTTSGSISGTPGTLYLGLIPAAGTAVLVR